MADGLDEVRAALAAMEQGEGDFDALKQAVAAARFDRREAHDMSVGGDYSPGVDTFEMTVTPAAVTRRITRDQWSELVAIWKANPPAGEDQ